MFDAIAPRYDLLNHLLSLNIDRLWRRFTTRAVPPEPGVPVLDCCTGTGDLALADFGLAQPAIFARVLQDPRTGLLRHAWDVEHARPIVVRYYLGSAHYRSTIDYHEGSLVEAEAAFSRIEGFLDRVARAVEATPEVEQTGALPVPDAFATAMDDDLGVPQALGVLHETVRQGNAAALDAGDTALAARLRAETIAMLGVLGLDPAEWAASTEGGAADAVLASLVEHLIGEREAARSTKDFAAADRVRDTLAAAGVVLEDTPTGPKWSI